MIRLCAADEVPAGEVRVLQLNGRALAVFRSAGGWFATQAECPHQGGPLADGIAAERSVICPLHERRFDLISGAPLGHECAGLQTYRVCERGGEVFLVGRLSGNDEQMEVAANGVQEPA